ncbi:hypothetical protein Mag101_04215 [Microbulbifer agarilyticus]|uniref:Pilus assembly protein E-set like domain-containing protein n=1 Tax=Microbulbifer agarilyticus TaxID=260552 RepID=A0A1Q2MAQ1_9GAMM|nr:hypothetical protein Mag101_04215 [Microbulbifer agarilyticus]
MIYDRERFRAAVFISQELQPSRAANVDPYLPESSSDFSAVQILRGIWSGSNTAGTDSLDGYNNESSALYGDTILSFGEGGVHSSWALSDQRNSQISRLHWAKDYRGKALSLGLIQSQAGFSSFITNNALYGLEYRRSDRSRTDRRYRQGSLLEVNMPLRGRVEIHTDGRLVHSELLEAGNQLLDTSDLPAGAYPVTIRTFDESGRLLSESEEYFSKDARLPAPNTWDWQLLAGQPVNLFSDEVLPEAYDQTLIQGTIGRRLYDNFGLYATVAATDREHAGEISLRWLSEYFELSPGIIHSNNGQSGFRVSGALRSPWLTLSASSSHLDEQQTFSNEPSYRLLYSGIDNRTAQLTTNILGGQLSGRYTRRSSAIPVSSTTAFSATPAQATDTFAQELKTLEYRFPFRVGRGWGGDIAFAVNDADGEKLATATFQLRYRSGRWNHTGRYYSENGASDNLQRGGFSTQWRDGDLWAAELDQRISTDSDGTEHLLSSQTNFAGRRGYLRSQINYRDGINDSLNYTGSFGTSLMANGSSFAWGGERTHTSGVLVDVKGAPGEKFEILVNGQRRGYAAGEGRSLINLPEFDSYNIEVKPLGEGFYHFRDISDTITLYPGNLAEASYEIKQVILVFGRLLQNGIPRAGIKLSIGEFSATTDEYGVFQMEMFGEPKTMRTPDVIWKDCRVPLPDQTSGKDWINLGVVELADARCPSRIAQRN